MDWLEEKGECVLRYVRNLSFQKAMIAYILLLAAVVWGLSYLTMVFCGQWEAAELAKYEQKDFMEIIIRKGPGWADEYPFAGTDRLKVQVLDLMRVWCPFIYAFAGMVVTICIFYRKRLARPLSILEDSVERIRGNDLDFQVYYDSGDELGNLCESVEDMRMELVRGKEEMWRLVERQKELNAAFAHDLRTPLTVLRGYTDFLARYIPEGKISQEKMQDTLSLMSDHLKRLEDYSRTMKGIRSIDEVPFAPEWTEIQSIAKKIGEVVFALDQIGDVRIRYGGCRVTDSRENEEGIGLLEGYRDTSTAQAEDKECRYRVQAEDKECRYRVQADDGIIMEVLENLLSNAIRYAGKEIEVMADYDVEEMEFLLTVRDDGRGFSPEQMEKALLPYHKEYEGLEMDEHFGIGLHICREFCKKHGGTLDVANSIQGGAVVTASFFCRT